MTPLLAWLLMLLFAAHLLGFLVLAVRRRQIYYLLLVTTFALLTASFGLYLFAPALAVAGFPAFQLMRYAAWASALLSLGGTVRRLWRRRTQRSTGRELSPPASGRE